MEGDDTRGLVQALREARDLLDGIGVTPWEGVNANVRRALISINQALYSMGEEESREG